jgi:hypothetical protein
MNKFCRDILLFLLAVLPDVLKQEKICRDILKKMLVYGFENGSVCILLRCLSGCL